MPALVEKSSDIDLTGYPAYLKAGYWIYDRISVAGRKPDILPDFNYTFKCILKMK
jgi:hypothetical protein